MPVLDTGQLRKGLTILLDGELCKIVDYEHNKRGRGTANIRITVRNLRTGSTVERTFMAGAKFEQAFLDRRTVQYLYNDGTSYYFMDTETYEQPAVSAEVLGDAVNYLRENDSVELVLYDGEFIDVELPSSVVLRVSHTEPGVKGDTASNATKPATLETGLIVNVPLFINEGDSLKIDTRSGQYLERVG
jgi:elongation factor P